MHDQCVSYLWSITVTGPGLGVVSLCHKLGYQLGSNPAYTQHWLFRINLSIW